MIKAITEEQFGAWVLKCNPRTWDLEAFRADGEDRIERQLPAAPAMPAHPTADRRSPSR